SGTDAGNYSTPSAETTTANITPLALTATGITAANKAYDGTTTATIDTSGAQLSGVLTGDNVTLNVTGASAAFASKAVGTGVTVNITGLTIGGASAGNYTLPSPQSTTANITPLALTVSATGVNKVYDGTTQATANLTGNSLPGDVVTFNYTAAFADKNVANGKAVSVTGIALEG